jgi:nucleotide-binding universal stress UspA family protein
MRKIIVGIDGSKASRAALNWAIDDAATRPATVRAVHVWDRPPLGAEPLDRMLADTDDLEAEARRELDLVVDEVDAGRLANPVERAVRCGRPADWLLHEAEDADMLVIGERGLGGVPMGSVGKHVVPRAHCPIVIVPTDDR